MSALRNKLIHKGYSVGNLNWNEERTIYELMVTGYEGTEDKEITGEPMVESFTPIKIGRGLIYSSDYQKCLLAGKNIEKNDHPPLLSKIAKELLINMWVMLLWPIGILKKMIIRHLQFFLKIKMSRSGRSRIKRNYWNFCLKKVKKASMCSATKVLEK